MTVQHEPGRGFYESDTLDAVLSKPERSPGEKRRRKRHRMRKRYGLYGGPLTHRMVIGGHGR